MRLLYSKRETWQRSRQKCSEHVNLISETLGTESSTAR